MENKYFKSAGDLDSDESRSSIVPGVEENKYFKPLRNLDGTPISMGVEVDGGYFKKAGDLDENLHFGVLRNIPEQKNDYFKPAGNLDDDGLGVESRYFSPLGKDSIRPIFLNEDKGDFRLLKNPEKIVDYFRPAGNLEDSALESESRHFRPLGDLDGTPISMGVEADDGYFRPAEDLNIKEIRSPIIPKIYDKNINSIDKGSLSSKKIEDYLLTVVSGKRYGSVCELGVLMGSGRMIVSFEELKRMVDEGYNIISAQCINADVGLIEVEFQKYVYDEVLMEKRRRF